MTDHIIRNYSSKDISQLIDLQKLYKKKYPNYIVRGEEVYTYHPVFENGRNIFCIFDSNGSLLAYAPIAPAPVNDDSSLEHSHYIWTDIIYNPEAKNLEDTWNLIFERVLERALEIKNELSQTRKTRLAIIKFADEMDGINYFVLKGFENYETVYVMCRDLSEPIQEIPVPANVCTRKWQIQTQEDKSKYIKADNLSNPNNPISLEKLEWNLKKLWCTGSAIGAFDKNTELVGSVMAYWLNDNIGFTEDIFVLPQWRRQGIAQYLVREALVYLKTCAKSKAELEVRKSNINAVNLYKKMGYKIDKEEWSIGLYI